MAVGSVPWHEDQAFWLSSRDEEEPTSEEHACFYAAIHATVENFTSAALADIGDALRRPHIAGDFFCCRSEELLLDPHALAGRLDGLIGTIDVVQRHLARPENLRWRVGYFYGDATLLIYPDAVCVGSCCFAAVDDAKGMLGYWLEYLGTQVV